MKLNIQHLLFALLGMLLSTGALSQTTPPPPGLEFDIKKSQPTSPNAAMLGRFGDIPVGYYTGTADVSIPMYTIKEEGLEIPVVLRYHGSGNKVEDQASNVGLGWSLEPGGSIIQVVNGSPDLDDQLVGSGPDDHGAGYTDGYDFLYNYNPIPSHAGDYASRTSVGSWILPCDRFAVLGDSRQTRQRLEMGDGQPDIYQYSFPGGYSGKFYLNPTTSAHEPILLDKNADIAFTVSSDVCTARTLDGTVYTFSAVEYSIPFTSLEQQYTSRTWKLTEIQLPSKRKIRFTYTTGSYQWPFYNESYHTNYLDAYDPSIIINNLDYRSPYAAVNTSTTRNIDSIVSATVKIKFTMESRADVPGGQRIASVDIRDAISGKKIKTYTLGYDYFAYNTGGGNYASSGVVSGWDYTADMNILGKRLKLTSLQETGYDWLSQAASSLPAYQFSYDESVTMPLKTSYARDYWGYYNGKIVNTKLLPDLTSFASYQDIPASMITAISGADRSVDTTQMGAYLLNRITYPTKGYTEFSYQVHHFDLHPYYGAGMRIAAIRNYSATGELLSSKRIKYGQGVLMSPLQYVHSRTLYFAVLEHGVLLDGIDPQTVYYVSSESAVPFSNAASGGIVGYSQVTEEEYVSSPAQTNGSHVYHYHNVKSGTMALMPDLPDLKNGKLEKEQVYNSANTLLQEINYTYTTKDSSHYNGVKIARDFYYYGSVCGDVDVLRFPNPAYGYTFYFYPMHSKWYVLSSKEVKSYDGATPVVSTESYTYNSKGQQITASLTNSKGETQSTSSLYPADAPQTDPMVQAMVSKGLYNNLLERSTKVNTTETSKTTISYRMDNQLVVQSAIDQSYNGQAPFTATRFDTYGPYATPRQVTQRGQVTSLFWDSSYHYLMASVTNATNGGTASNAATVSDYIPATGSNPISASFTTYSAGTVILTIDPNPGYTYSITYTLTGPGGYSHTGTLCASRSSETCSNPETVTLTGVPAGALSLSMNRFSNASTPPNPGLSIVYPGSQVTSYENQVYQENFEEMGGNTSTAHTGHQGHTGSFSPAFTAPSGRTYVLSYWSWNGSSWTYSGELAYTGQTLSGTIDDVRVYPSDARMSTYTYDPLVGLTSQVDDKGQTTYYQYDANQRLHQVKDQEGNILKQYDYNYKH